MGDLSYTETENCHSDENIQEQQQHKRNHVKRANVKIRKRYQLVSLRANVEQVTVNQQYMYYRMYYVFYNKESDEKPIVYVYMYYRVMIVVYLL